ncbi:MAG TPA: LCP family protein [Thermomicrobiales bacterium]|jgi:LCP family protein required for cell wall assembly
MTTGIDVPSGDALAGRGPANDGSAASDVSRRLSGSAWQPAMAIPGGEFAGTAVLPAPVRRPRRHRRRHWYRRKLVVIPSLVAVLVAGLAAGVLLRAGSTIAELQSVSSPPPSVALQDAAGAPAVSVDTAPAQAAVQADRAARGEQQSGDTSLFGDFKQKAGDVGDAAGGAAAAAGLTNPATGTMNILVMGVDARPGAPIDIAVKADAIVVLHLNPEAKSCRILSIPRDTRTELPGYGQSKINHALLVGGIPYQRLVVEKLLGITMDHYALIDFAGFQELVDAVGGVKMTIPEAIDQQQLATQGAKSGGPVVFKAGTQTLDGAQALAYARYRGGPEGDIGRVKRQWAVMRGLAAAGNGRDPVKDVNQLLPAVEDHVRTDLNATQLAAIAKTFGGSCTEQTMGTDVLEGSRIQLDDPLLKQTVYYNVVDEPVIRQRVAELLGS